jgi:hypothetical protein
VHVRSEFKIRKFTAGALPFGYFPLGKQGKVTRVQGGAPAKGINVFGITVLLIFVFFLSFILSMYESKPPNYK